MAKAKCFKCGATALADTFEQARKKLNHAVGMSRGIKCGDNYGKVKEIKDKLKTPPPQKDTIKTEIPKKEIESTSEPTLEEPKKEKTKSKTKKQKYL